MNQAEMPIDGNTLVDDKFWLVICTEANEEPHGKTFLTRGYKCVHEFEADAEREAVRLATLYKGYYFAVVESKAIVRFDRKRNRLIWQDARLPIYRRDPRDAHTSNSEPTK